MKYSRVMHLILVLSVLNISAYAQETTQNDDSNAKREWTKSIGYACGFTGSPSDVVVHFGNLLEEKKYDEIVDYLNSENPAENYMALIISERLEGVEVYTFSEAENQRREMIANMDVNIPYCSGCTEFSEVPLKDLIPLVSLEANVWLDEYLPLQNETPKKYGCPRPVH